MSRPTRRLLLGLALLPAVYAAVTATFVKFFPFQPDPMRALRAIPLGVGLILLAGILAYFAACLLAAVFFAGRRLASKEAPPLSDFLAGEEGDPVAGKVPAPVHRKIIQGLVPALAEYVWMLVWMGVFSLVSTLLMVGLTKFLSHRAG